MLPESHYDRLRLDAAYREWVADGLGKQAEKYELVVPPNKRRQVLGEAYEGIVEFIKDYMDMPEDQIKLIALWIVGTYFHEHFSTYPFLFINAMRGSGKTRLLNIISHFSKGGKGNVQTGLTESVLFRSPPGETLVLDECESLGGKDKAILREYLNACYKKGGVVRRMKKVKREGKEDYEVDTFSPYKPIAMANIWGIEEVLGDRCISVVLEKSSNPSKTKKIEDFEKNPEILAIIEKLTGVSVVYAVSFLPRTYNKRWNNFINGKYSSIDYTIYNTTQTTNNNIHASKQDNVVGNLENNTYNTHITQTTENNTTTLEENSYLDQIEEEVLFNKIDEMGIDGRNFELLFPLLLLSHYLDPHLFDEFLRIGRELMESKREDEIVESRDITLYEFVANIREQTLMHSVKELTNEFKVWLGESSDEWINERWMGRALKRLNLVVDKRRVASGRMVLLNVPKAKEKTRIFKKDPEVENG